MRTHRMNKSERIILSLFGKEIIKPTDDLWERRMKAEKKVHHTTVSRKAVGKTSRRRRVHVK